MVSYGMQSTKVLCNKQQSRTLSSALLFVELERFELSSSHGTVYAFYMFSFSLIVERGKVSRLPIPYAVVAVSHKCLATSHLPVLLFDAPNVKPKNRI